VIPQAETFTTMTVQFIAESPVFPGDITVTLYDNDAATTLACTLQIPEFINPGQSFSTSCTGSVAFAAQDVGYVKLTETGRFAEGTFIASVGLVAV
jgi:hypothetical protein